MRKRDILNYSIILLSVILLSCSFDQESRHSFKVEEIDGIPVALTTGGPKYYGELFEYQEELRLVGDPEHPDSYLVNPDSPVMDATGNFYINDSEANQIVSFDAAGRFRYTIGREGQGPGDLDFPRNLCIVGDTLHVNSHVVSWRLTRFTTDGHLVDLTVQRVPTNMAIPTLYWGPSGHMLIQVNDLPVVGNDWFVKSRMVVLSTNKDTVAVIETPRVPFGKTFARNEEGIPYAPVMMQYAGYPTIGFKPELGIYSSSGIDPMLRYYDLSGALSRVVRIDIDPEEITLEERNTYLAALRRELHEARNRPNPSAFNIARLEGMISDPPFQPFKGYWRDVDIDDADWIWLSLVEPPSEVQTEPWAPHYRVLSPEGEYLGDTRWPQLEDGHVWNGRLLGIQEDPETGEKIPIIWRLVSKADGFVYP